jgi:hypothetical protein
MKSGMLSHLSCSALQLTVAVSYKSSNDFGKPKSAIDTQAEISSPLSARSLLLVYLDRKFAAGAPSIRRSRSINQKAAQTGFIVLKG